MSKNLKAMLEKRNAMVTEIQDIANTVELETRGFDEAEITKVGELKAEVAELDESIKQIKELRGLATAETEAIEGEKTMEAAEMGKELELRGMEQYLRGKEGEELRALTEANTLGNDSEGTAGNGGITVPTNVYQDIIEKMGETAPVFQAARKFGSVTGNLKVAREDNIEDEGFIGETLDASKIKPILKSVTLTQKRVGAAIQLTNQLINDSGVDIVGYAQTRLTRSVGRAIERAILIGAKVGEDSENTFRPIIGDANVANVETAAAKALTVEEILGVYGSLNPVYLDGAMFIVSREVFNTMLKLKDGDGSYLVFRGIVSGKPGYTLFGCPIHVSDVLKDATREIVFGNINEAYGMLVKKNMNLITVTADTTQALAGGRLTILDAYMDGAVINPAAVVTAGPKLV